MCVCAKHVYLHKVQFVMMFVKYKNSERQQELFQLNF